MPVFNNILAGAAGSGGSDASYTIKRSLRFNSGDSAYLNRQPPAQGNRTTWTWSGWVKRTAMGADKFIFSAGTDASNMHYLRFKSNDTLEITEKISDQVQYSLITNAVYRDPSAWYHIVYVYDSTQSTAADRLCLYVNGVKLSSSDFGTSTYPSQNHSSNINSQFNHLINARPNPAGHADQYLTEIHFVDGQALTASDFGAFDADTGVWNPKEYATTFQLASGTPTTANGGIVIKADDSSINGTFVVSGGVKTWTSPDGQTWTRNGSGRSSAAAKYLAVGGAGTATKSFYPDAGSGNYTYFVYNGNEFDGSSSPFTLDLTSQTYIAPSDSSHGLNGYYLDFSDNSSDAALGIDANVSGTRYSHYVTGFGSPGPANMFDGDATNSYTASASNTRMTFTPPTAIPYTDAYGGVEVAFMASASGQLDRVRINGGSWVTQPSGGGWHKVSTGNGSITSMDFEDEGTQEAVIHAIRVNGTILTDPSGANDWTVNNVTSSVPTYTATAASGALDSSIFDGSNTKTYWQTSITITGITVASGANFGYRGVVESGNSAPSHTITKNGTQIGSFTGTVGNNNWVASTNYTVNQGTISEAIGPSDTVVITTNVQAWHGTDQITINGSPIVQPSVSGTDSLIDTPTNYEASSGNNGGNYATLNPLHNGQTLSNGNLDVTGGSSWQRSVSTIAMSSGQWYWEYEITASNEHIIGVGPLDMQMSGNLGAGSPPGSGYGTELGQVNGTGANSSWTNTGGSTAGDVIGVAFDADAGKMYIYKNGTALNSGIPSHTGLTDGPYYAVFSLNGSSRSGSVNFGQRPFKYTNAGTDRPAATYLSLCTQNLTDPTIEKPSTAFDVKLWTGNGTTQSITGYSFSPDLVWTKQRNSAGFNALFDPIRGVHNALRTHSSGGTYTDNGLLTAFNSDGFSIGSAGDINGNNNTYVGWAWDTADSNTNVSAGGLNSSAYDQSQTWSNSLSATFRSSEPATNAFDGDTSTIAGSAGTITYTSPVSVASSSSIRVFVHGGDHNVSVNGGANQTVAAGSFVTLNFTNPTNSTFTITFDRVGTADTGVRAIEIGGKLLVDSGVSGLTNVPKVATTYRANPSAGFSIVNASVAASLTGGPTLAHGLNKKPEFIIGKNRDSSIYWYVYHKDLTENHYLIPNLDSSEQNSGAVWGSHSSLDSNVFQIGAGTPASMWIPSGTDDCIFYVWTSVDSYSSFGSYVGNGSTDGTFVYTGFRPAFVVMKSTSAAGGWRTYDSTRKTYNEINNSLHWNTTEDETAYSNDEIDFLSNGFKARAGGSFYNGNGTSYIYAAFAENPFKIARAR